MFVHFSLARIEPCLKHAQNIYKPYTNHTQTIHKITFQPRQRFSKIQPLAGGDADFAPGWPGGLTRKLWRTLNYLSYTLHPPSFIAHAAHKWGIVPSKWVESWWACHAGGRANRCGTRLCEAKNQGGAEKGVVLGNMQVVYRWVYTIHTYIQIVYRNIHMILWRYHTILYIYIYMYTHDVSYIIYDITDLALSGCW